MDGKLPSELTFAYSIINNLRLSCLTYGIVCINNHVAYITNGSVKFETRMCTRKVLL